jgi:hypothetical protein
MEPGCSQREKLKGGVAGGWMVALTGPDDLGNGSYVQATDKG